MRDKALWFVDISLRRLHWFRPGGGATGTINAPDRPGFVWPAAVGGLVVGLPGALFHCDAASGVFSPLLVLPDERPGNRINDGCVDRHGRLWFGTMDDAEVKRSGALYSWDGVLRRHDDGIAIANGPCVSPDGRRFYHTDSAAKTIYVFKLSDDGALTDKQVFVRIEDGAGWPDGTTVDAAGCLWVGMWGGFAARRYAPGGDLAEMVAFPCANVSKLAFGGGDGRTLFATTARLGLSAEAKAAQPLAGGLFRFDVAVPGLPVVEVGAGGGR